MKISIIIPTLNEAQRIGALINYLRSLPKAEVIKEIIVVDGGSTDETIQEARKAGVYFLETQVRSRAKQMNQGAQQASGNILYFLHADVFPPRSCYHDILESIEQRNCFGCFAYRLDSSIPWLKVHGYMTRFNLISTGGGDQSLFIRKTDFEAAGGFDEALPIMEDFDFVWRTKRILSFCVLKEEALVSARRYEQYGYWKVLWVDTLVFFGFRWGKSPLKLVQWYRKQLK